MHPNENQCHKFAGLPLLIGVAAFAAMAIAVQTPAQQTTPDAPGTAAQVILKHATIKYVPPNSGQKMYVEYCAVCHGAMAKGDGPAAPALSERPTDLTMLSARNGGKFPERHVRLVLTDNEPESLNGSVQMPHWCRAFHSLDSYSPLLLTERAYNLANYVKTLQTPASNEVRAAAVSGHQR